MKAKASLLTGALALMAGLQFIRPDTSNPPVNPQRSLWHGHQVDPRVAGILRRACGDCHSHETQWPWYARITPISFLVDRHVREGRAKLNFSDWDGPSPDQLEEILDSVEKQKMPTWDYLLLHPQARLTKADRDILQSWVDGKLAKAEPH